MVYVVFDLVAKTDLRGKYSDRFNCLRIFTPFMVFIEIKILAKLREKRARANERIVFSGKRRAEFNNDRSPFRKCLCDTRLFFLAALSI